MNRTRMAMLAAALVPSLVMAQGAMGQSKTMQDTTGKHRTRSAQAGSMYGLTKDQFTLLQQGLTAAGCNAGTADGKMTQRTQTAIRCAEKKNNITSHNINDLLRSMNLGFTAPDSMGARRSARAAGRDTTMRSSNGAIRRDSAMTRPRTRRDTSMMRRDSTMGRDSMGARRPPRAKRDSTMRDTTRRPPR